MTQKSLDTLPNDIYELFNPNKGHEPCEDNLEEFAQKVKEILRTRLALREDVGSPLRFSSLGRPDRQIYFMAHPDGKEEELTPKTFFKFLYGDIIELMILFLAKEAGHKVEMEQAEVEIDGVLGHIDAIIDGVVVDVKSASPFSYQKFRKGEVLENDPFGYVGQLSGYADVLTPGKSAAWIAFDKVGGDICVAPLSASVIRGYETAKRLEHLKEVIKSDEVPALCHDPVEDGKSGNMKLGTACSYCKFKKRCHPNLRTFLYSNGPRFLTNVAKTPDVPEVKEAIPDEV